MKNERLCGALVIIITLEIDVACGQGFKRWMPSTNFEDAGNWDSGRLPCSRDRVVLPRSAPPIYVQTNATLTELVLPSDGELILGDFASFSFPVEQGGGDTSCPGTEVKYNHTEPDSWFDVTNWCVTSDPEGDCSASQPLVLDSEKIPCRYDTAVFPQGRSFLVTVDSGVDVYLKALILDGQKHTTGSFRRLLDSKDGQFVRSSEGSLTTVNIRDDECSDSSGCACGNDQAAILDRVCRTVECPEIQCHGSFKPMGSCCARCGALLELDYTREFRISSLKNMIERNYLKKSPEYNGVQYIASKTSFDHVQLVLIDDAEGDKASKLGSTITEYLRRGENRRYGVSHVDLTLSNSGVPQKQEFQKANKGLGKGSIIGIIMVVIILLIIILIALYIKLRRSDTRLSNYFPKLPKMNSLRSSFKSFNRFSMSSEEKNGLEVGPSIGFSDTVTMSELSRGFDNPMYAEPGATAQPQTDDEPYVIDTSDLHLSNRTSNGFTNPLYGDGPVEELVHGDLGVSSMLKFNPVFTTEGIEEDSEI